jgi:hypothetical protein
MRDAVQIRLVSVGALLLLACSSAGTGAPPDPDNGSPPAGKGDAGSSARGGSGGGGGAASGGTAGGADTGGASGAAGSPDAPAALDVPAGNDSSAAPADTGGDRAPEPPATGPDIVVPAFKAANIYFGGEMDNHRHANATVDFPTDGRWKKVALRFRLSCPAGRCDIWDRWGYIGIANGAGKDAPVTEIMRFATPYGVGADWTVDVTSLAPLLKGQKTLATFIDTWVGPGHPQGNGWLVDATFTFTPGNLDLIPTEVIPLWDVASVEVGDPAKPPAVPTRKATIRADAAAVELRGIITGHGQGNLENCAEFCPKKHTYGVAGMDVTRTIWRTDCATTAVRPQGGRFPFASRAGWCPGATVVPWVADVTAAAKAGTEASITYAPEGWENTCRPNASACKGCVGASCAYDDGGHTAPNYVQSALMIVYTRATPP